MHSIKNYTMTANNTITRATVYVYQGYPQLYKFVIENTDSQRVNLIVRVMYLLAVYLLLRGILRTLMDPFSVRLNAKVLELENNLSESEEMYNQLYEEKCEADAEIVDLTKKLKKLEKELANVKRHGNWTRNLRSLKYDAVYADDEYDDTQG